MRVREGVTASVNAAMEAVQANVLSEDGLLMRVCEHGIRHPVGHLHRDLDLGERGRDQRRHDVPRPWGLWDYCACDGCCAPWLLGVPVTVDAVDPVEGIVEG